MKNSIILLLIAFALVGCAKDDNGPDNSGKTLRAKYTFASSASLSEISYENKGSGFKGGSNRFTGIKTFTDDVRVGDNIQLFMRGTNDPVGGFSITLQINDKVVKEVKGDKNNLFLNLQYTVTDRDFE